MDRLTPGFPGIVISLAGVAAYHLATAVNDLPAVSLETVLLAFVKEGGTIALLGVVIYFYRRDSLRLADQTVPILDLAKQASVSNAEVAAHLAAQMELMREVKDVLKDVAVQLQSCSVRAGGRPVTARTRASDKS